MADYFVKLSRIHPRGEPFFIGPFDKKDEAYTAVQEAKKNAEFELVTEDQQPSDIAKAILAEILTKTNASRTGMRFGDKKNNLIGEKIPLNLEEVGIEKTETRDNGSGRTQEQKEVIEDKIEYDDEIIHVKDEEETYLKQDSFEKEIEDSLIVVKFPENLEWLRQQGIKGEAVLKARLDQIEGRSVIGTLPYRLGERARRVGIIDLPELKMEKAGQSLNTSDLYDAGARLRWYRVIEEKDEWRKLFAYLDNHPKGWKKLMEIID
jgi:hypothetical protein